MSCRRTPGRGGGSYLFFVVGRFAPSPSGRAAGRQKGSIVIGTIEDTMREFEDSLFDLPNVEGVAIGEADSRPVIIVLVSRKVPETELTPEQRVPATLGDYEVVVEEAGHITAS